MFLNTSFNFPQANTMDFFKPPFCAIFERLHDSRRIFYQANTNKQTDTWFEVGKESQSWENLAICFGNHNH